MKKNILANQLVIEHQSDGRIGVKIPSHLLWDCVECFGENGLNVHFTFMGHRFNAQITGTSPQRILEALKNWQPLHPRATSCLKVR